MLFLLFSCDTSHFTSVDHSQSELLRLMMPELHPQKFTFSCPERGYDCLCYIKASQVIIMSCQDGFMILNRHIFILDVP